MSPRPYRLGRRQAAKQETRGRILAAARQMLTAKSGSSRFTIDAVAEAANVARMTVYYQFKNKRELLEALYGDIAARGELKHLDEAFANPDPLAALLDFIGIFIRFWSSDRLLIRRVHALAALDPEIREGLHSHEARRKRDLQHILTRVKEQYGHPTARKLPEAVDILHMLTSFEAFDDLSGATRKAYEVGDTVMRLALAAVVLYGAPLGE